MAKAYVITDGCWSDYGIVEVFLDKELADEYVKKHVGDYRVEEYEVRNKKFVDKIRRIVKVFGEFHNGTPVLDECNPYVQVSDDPQPMFEVNEYGTYQKYTRFTSVVVLRSNELDDDKAIERAKKVTYDRAYQWILEKELEGEG